MAWCGGVFSIWIAIMIRILTYLCIYLNCSRIDDFLGCFLPVIAERVFAAPLPSPGESKRAGLMHGVTYLLCSGQELLKLSVSVTPHQGVQRVHAFNSFLSRNHLLCMVWAFLLLKCTPSTSHAHE